MGLYVNTQMVKERLTGKIRFTTDPETYPDKMPVTLLHDLILQAETEVELSLSPRYATPFQTIAGTAFCNLPMRPTKGVIRNLCVLRAVMKCLNTDFGRGSSVKGSNYYDDIKKEYDDIVEKLTELKSGSFNTFVYPPLEGLRLNWQNEEADTGFKGRVLTSNCGENADNYAANQINAPSRTLWNPDPKDFDDFEEGPSK